MCHESMGTSGRGAVPGGLCRPRLRQLRHALQRREIMQAVNMHKVEELARDFPEAGIPFGVAESRVVVHGRAV